MLLGGKKYIYMHRRIFIFFKTVKRWITLVIPKKQMLRGCFSPFQLVLLLFLDFVIDTLIILNFKILLKKIINTYIRTI